MKSKGQTPRSVKKLFIGSILLAWLASVAQTVGLMAMQYSSNPNMSGHISWLLSGIAVPAVLIGVSYVMRKNKKLSLDTIFEVAVITTAAIAFFGSVSMLMLMMPPYFAMTAHEVLMQQLLYSGMPLALTVLVLAGILFRLRRSNQW
jgi:TRAP-type mannitol/chloroaromatic compound transport system permease small subunit